MLDRDYEISADACDLVLDIVRQNVPFVAVDLPHTWTPWVKRVLLQADEIVITAVPDLANLRNAKNLIDLLKQNRTNDGPPHLVAQRFLCGSDLLPQALGDRRQLLRRLRSPVAEVRGLDLGLSQLVRSGFHLHLELGLLARAGAHLFGDLIASTLLADHRRLDPLDSNANRRFGRRHGGGRR